jgi:hypothetical protein
MRKLLAGILVLSLSSLAVAKELDIADKHELELMQRKRADVEKEIQDTIQRIRKKHEMKATEDWDGNGVIFDTAAVKKPSPPRIPISPPTPPKK